MGEQEKNLYHLPIERVRETEMELRGAFVSVLFRVILPKLEEEFGEVKEAATSRHWEGDDEFRMLFYVTPVSDPFITFLPRQLVDRLAFSLDLALANRDVILDRRKVILESFLRICQETFGLESVEKSRYFKYFRITVRSNER